MTAKKTDNFLPLGRPSKYNEEMIEKAQDYIENYNSKYEDVIPMIEGLSIVLGVCKDTINEWEKVYPDFSVVVRTLMAHQGRRLMNGSLSGELREKTACLALSSNHGLVNKTETDLKSSDGSMQPTVIEIVGYGEDESTD